MFISDNFYLDGIHCDEIGVSLITLDNDIINRYGLDFDREITQHSEVNSNHIYFNEKDNVKSFVLNICPSIDNYRKWDRNLIDLVYNWVLQDRFMPFISEDDPYLTYYVKPIKIVKYFSSSMEGYLEITFQPLSNYAYNLDVQDVTIEGEKIIKIDNISNIFDEYYYPIIEVENFSDGEDIIIENLSSDSEPMVISGLAKNEKIIIDNSMYVVTNDANENLLCLTNRKWLKLVKGINFIRISGNCNILIKSEFPCFG